MAVLITAIHVFLAESKAWMAGTRPAMTGREQRATKTSRNADRTVQIHRNSLLAKPYSSRTPSLAMSSAMFGLSVFAAAMSALPPASPFFTLAMPRPKSDSAIVGSAFNAAS